MATRTFEEVDNPRRVDLINKLSKVLDDCPVDPAIWAMVWLADMDKLEKYVDQMAAVDPVIAAASNCESKFSAKALKTWTTRGHVGKDDSATEESRKRKSKGDDSYEDGSPSKSVRPAERPTDEAAVSEAEGSRGRSPAKSRPQSRTKIPIVRRSDQVGSATPATPATPSTPAPTRATSPKPQSRNRSGRMITQCKLRDGGLCLLTKGGDVPEVAHIYAFSIGNQVGRTGYKKFWNILRLFWSEDKIKSWEHSVLGDEGTETLANLMCMDPTVHALWGKARFAIKPLELSSDKKTLRVEFHWLPAMKYLQRHLVTAPTSPINTIGAPGGTHLYYCPTDRRIETGDVLTFTTKDPENLPLPSVDLLDMQWVLNRLTALSGAADVSDEELDSDDAPGLAPPICVGEGIDISPSEEEAEQGQEQEGDNGKAAEGQSATQSASGTAGTRAGENVPFRESKDTQRHAPAEANPLSPRTRDPNVY